MRILLFLATLAVIGLVVTGAIHLKKSGDTITIQIDKKKVAEDVDRFVDDGKEVLEKVEAALNDDDDTDRR